MEQVCLDTKDLVEIILKYPAVKDEGNQSYSFINSLVY